MAILVVAEAVGITAEQDALAMKALDLEGSPPRGSAFSYPAIGFQRRGHASNCDGSGNAKTVLT